MQIISGVPALQSDNTGFCTVLDYLNQKGTAMTHAYPDRPFFQGSYIDKLNAALNTLQQVSLFYGFNFGTTERAPAVYAALQAAATGLYDAIDAIGDDDAKAIYADYLAHPGVIAEKAKEAARAQAEREEFEAEFAVHKAPGVEAHVVTIAFSADGPAVLPDVVLAAHSTQH